MSELTEALEHYQLLIKRATSCGFIGSAELDSFTKDYEIVHKALSGGWEGMESAPKDKSRILVTRAPYTGFPAPINIVRWTKGRFDAEGWNISSHKRLRWEPTHWQLLPEPPKEG